MCIICLCACACVCVWCVWVCAQMYVCMCKVQKPTLYAAKWQIFMPNFSSDNKHLTLVQLLQTKLSDIWTYKLHPSYSVCSNTPNSQTVVPISDSFVAIVCFVSSSSSFWGGGSQWLSSELISVSVLLLRSCGPFSFQGKSQQSLHYNHMSQWCVSMLSLTAVQAPWATSCWCSCHHQRTTESPESRCMQNNV